MDFQNLIIYKFKPLYQIMKELEINSNFEFIEISSEKILNDKIIILKNYLIVTQKKIANINHQIVINQLPIKISKLLEKFNIELLKIKFNEQSELNIGKYKINLNSRELVFNNSILKLTEKETNIIVFLSKLKIPVRVSQLQSEVWGYHSELETHTVETHIYRLRKKILKVFGEANFIISKKEGYQIN
tara:strand:- start:983 stop:1546 length:564 start_codon:yes stop_codon:yes gene_type:complete